MTLMTHWIHCLMSQLIHEKPRVWRALRQEEPAGDRSDRSPRIFYYLRVDLVGDKKATYGVAVLTK